MATGRKEIGLFEYIKLCNPLYWLSGGWLSHLGPRNRNAANVEFLVDMWHRFVRNIFIIINYTISFKVKIWLDYFWS